MILYCDCLGTGTCNQHNNREGERRTVPYEMSVRVVLVLSAAVMVITSIGWWTNIFWYCKNSEYRSNLRRLLRTKNLKNNDMTHTSQRYMLTCPCCRKIFNIMGLQSVSGLTNFFVNRARGKNEAPIADIMQTACRHPLLATS